MITLTKTQCGSYEVSNHGKIIGYAVEPFYNETIDSMSDVIVKVENLVKAKHKNRYNEFYRLYAYRKNKVNDIILIVRILSPKQVLSISNWQCEEQDIEAYEIKSKCLFEKRYAPTVYYNCSKDRIASPWEPE